MTFSDDANSKFIPHQICQSPFSVVKDYQIDDDQPIARTYVQILAQQMEVESDINYCYLMEYVII